MAEAAAPKSLFSDVYHVSEDFFGRTPADTAIERMQQDVLRDIETENPEVPLRYLAFKLTNRCNSDCSYCAHRISNYANERKVDVPFDSIMQAIDDAASLGAHAISLTGGEVLLRKDLPVFIKAIADRGVVPVVLTNGILMPRRWRELGEAGLRYVIISFDSLDPEMYERQRGQKFEKAIAGIDAAVEMMEAFPGTRVNVTCVVTKDNPDDVTDLIKYMSARGIGVQLNPYHHHNPMEPDTLSIRNPAAALDLARDLLTMKDDGYLITSSNGFIEHMPDFFVKGQRMPTDYHCPVGYTSLFVDTYGNAIPCWDAAFEPLGNINDERLADMWNGPRMQNYRRRMHDLKCGGCWYNCTAEVGMLVSGRM